jgi:hypothetical protein
MNNERFLRAAFNPEHNGQLQKAALLRRNVYLTLSITGFACIFIAAFAGRTMLSILSLFLSTLSLVVMTKYDTQLFFLKVIKLDGVEKDSDSTSGT